MNQLTDDEMTARSSDRAAATTDAPEDAPRLGTSVGKAAGLLASEVLTNGDRAALRRIAPAAPFTPELWNVLHRLKQDTAPSWVGQQTWERRWATLLMGMAHCISPHQNMLDYDVPLGSALAEAGWSELRFVQLVRARGETLEVHVRRVAQYLASKSQKANWVDVARLLFYQSGDTADSVRLSIARNYYGRLYQKESEQSN